jgi:hypothetical protein
VGRDLGKIFSEQLSSCYRFQRKIFKRELPFLNKGKKKDYVFIMANSRILVHEN